MTAAVVSYSVKTAAEATGMSQDIIRNAIRSGQIVARYPTSKPLILATDLIKWVEESPTERAA